MQIKCVPWNYLNSYTHHAKYRFNNAIPTSVQCVDRNNGIKHFLNYLLEHSLSRATSIQIYFSICEIWKLWKNPIVLLYNICILKSFSFFEMCVYISKMFPIMFKEILNIIPLNIVFHMSVPRTWDNQETETSSCQKWQNITQIWCEMSFPTCIMNTTTLLTSGYLCIFWVFMERPLVGVSITLTPQFRVPSNL